MRRQRQQLYSVLRRNLAADAVRDDGVRPMRHAEIAAVHASVDAYRAALRSALVEQVHTHTCTHTHIHTRTHTHTHTHTN